MNLSPQGKMSVASISADLGFLGLYEDRNAREIRRLTLTNHVCHAGWQTPRYEILTIVHIEVTTTLFFHSPAKGNPRARGTRGEPGSCPDGLSIEGPGLVRLPPLLQGSSRRVGRGLLPAILVCTRAAKEWMVVQKR